MLRHGSSSFFVPVCCAALIVAGCNFSSPISSAANKNQGIAQIKITYAANSPFQLIARTADVSISASDMNTMVKGLTITSSTVEGLVTQIPTGSNRLFVVSVYDSAKVVRYRGSNYATIIADSTAQVTIILYRIGGDALINGSVSEDPGPSIITPDVTAGLLAYYPFNGNAADESDHGLNATVNGATLTTDRFGNANKAYYFNGNAGISATVPVLLSLSKFTLCVWMKGSIPGSYLPRLISVGPAGQANNYYGILYANGVWNHAPEVTKRIIFMNAFTNDYYGYSLQYSNGIVDTLAWHHVAVSYDSGNLKFYIDGVLDKDMTFTTQIAQFTATAVLQIGYSEGPDRYVGKLDDVRIYNRVLNGQEVSTVFSSRN
jgi:hypothetical protein